MSFRDEFKDDCKRTEVLLEGLYSLLREISVGKIQLEDGSAIPRELQEQAWAAWQELEETLPLSRAKQQLENAGSKQMRRAGLTGAQLALKLSVIDRIWEKFKRLKLRKLLLLLLDAIDNALKSLVQAAGIDHALEEMKDTLRTCIQDGGAQT